MLTFLRVAILQVSSSQHSHPQIAVLHVDILEGCHPEVDPRHDASLEHSTLQVHTLQIRPAPSRILKVCPFQVGCLEVGTHHFHSQHLSPVQLAMGEVSSLQEAPGEIGSRKLGTPQVGVLEVDVAKVKPGQVSARQVCALKPELLSESVLWSATCRGAQQGIHHISPCQGLLVPGQALVSHKLLKTREKTLKTKVASLFQDSLRTHIRVNDKTASSKIVEKGLKVSWTSVQQVRPRLVLAAWRDPLLLVGKHTSQHAGRLLLADCRP